MRALIIGGGVAGAALGMFLKRVGIESLICEARDRAALAEGAFLGVAPNGMHVLAQLGLAQHVLAAGDACLGFRFQNARGESIGTLDNQQDRERFGAPLVMIKRGALQSVLLDGAAREDVRVVLGKKLSAVAQDERGVTATFDDGSSERADLLIGCDGLRSRTRSLVLPDSPEPDYSGLIDYGGVVTARGDEPLEPGYNVMVFGKRAFFGAFVGARGEILWFHNGGHPEPQRDPESYGRARMIEAHRGDPAWIGALIARTPTLLGPWLQHDILSLPRWHRDRVCLIGDAAHATTPSSGQGASLALEDACLLARCLREQPGPTGGFASFQALRRARVEKIVQHSRRTGGTKAPSSAVGAWFRDRMLPTFLKLGASAQQAAYAYRADLDSPPQPAPSPSA